MLRRIVNCAFSVEWGFVSQVSLDYNEEEGYLLVKTKSKGKGDPAKKTTYRM